MEKLIRVVVVRPDAPPKIETIKNKLEEFQAIVGGYIETLPAGHLPSGRIIAICNEEGRMLGLEPSCYIGTHFLMGNVIFVAASKSGNFKNLSEKDAQEIINVFNDSPIL